MLRVGARHLHELQVGVQAQQVHQVEHHADLAHVARAVLCLLRWAAVRREHLHAHLRTGGLPMWAGSCSRPMSQASALADCVLVLGTLDTRQPGGELRGWVWAHGGS